MKIELKYFNDTEVMQCPDDVFFVGLQFRDKNRDENITTLNEDIMKMFFDTVKCETVVKYVNERIKLKLFYFTCDDPSFSSTMKQFQGLKILEFSAEELEVTITV